MHRIFSNFLQRTDDARCRVQDEDEKYCTQYSQNLSKELMMLVVGCCDEHGKGVEYSKKF